ncbi:MAG: sialate O-acetylesterase [Sphingobacteriaceae bacterium]|nr:MAG: sialate O-acetylesterase [Sphingobacteriaceae bacterium]
MIKSVKLLITVVVFTAATQKSFAQKTKWDSTYRPAGYQPNWQQFKLFKQSAADVVFLGNSITANINWAELLDLPQAKNRGISGDISYGVLERLGDVIAGKPAKIFILIGINDISRNIPDSLIIANHKKIINRIKAGSPGTKIYFYTLLPVNSSFNKFPNHYNKDEHIIAVNEAIRRYAKEFKITVIDLYPSFLDEQQHLKAAYTLDGLHLTAAGYQVWANLLKNGNYLR